MKAKKSKANGGFSLIELIIAMTVMLILLSIVSTLIARSFSVRAREGQQSDALAAAQAAISVLSREVANSGFGIYDNDVSKLGNNGVVLADSNAKRIHIRANLTNTGPRPAPAGSTVLATMDPGEDVTYFFDAATQSIVRYDPNDTPQTSVVVNRISDVTFQYFDYAGSSSTASGPNATPTLDTGRVRITVEVTLDPVPGQPDNQRVTFASDVTLRNANYMLQQY